MTKRARNKNKHTSHFRRKQQEKSSGDLKKPREHPRYQALQQKAHTQTAVRGHTMEMADIFKFVGLIAFFAVMLIACVLIWPYVHEMFEPGGVERVSEEVRKAGPAGFLIILAVQFLQVVVAFIPGEMVQIAAGMIYGPWLGALIILVGCVISSAFVFALVHKLGAPFVQAMVPEKYMGKFRNFEQSGKLNIIIFILFLIPGMPKDVFTYITPLTDMPMKTFLLITNFARIPGIVISTYAADGLVEGRIWQSAIIFIVVAAIALVAILFHDRILGFFDKKRHKA